jgi:hypothetical protein
MSKNAPSANLLVRSLYARWGRGDYSSDDWADPRIELVFAHVLEGRVTTLVHYFDRDRALADLGLQKP